MHRKRNHLHSKSRLVNSVKPIPSTQLDVRQIERELLSRERRRSFISSHANLASNNKTVAKSSHAHYRHNSCMPLSQECTSQHQNRSCENARPVQTNSNETFHPRNTPADKTNSGFPDARSQCRPTSGTNDVNLNAQHLGRSSERAHNSNRRERFNRRRVGRPKKIRTNFENQVMGLPVKPVLKIWEKRKASQYSRSSRSPSHYSFHDEESRNTHSFDDGRSDRVSSPSRYQVTPYLVKDEQHSCTYLSQNGSHEHRRSPSGSSRSSNISNNSSPCSDGKCYRNHPHQGSSRSCVYSSGSRKSNNRRRLSRAGRRHRWGSSSRHHRKKCSHSRDRPAGKWRSSPGAVKRAKTIIQRVASAWSAVSDNKQKNKRSTKRSRKTSSSKNDRDKGKRHKSGESRSRSRSEGSQRRKSSRKNSSGGYLICRLM